MERPKSEIIIVFKKLLHNKAATAGILVILMSILIAVFAYWIAPDSSPNANRMILEINGMKPGFTIKFLKIPSSNAEVSWFTRTLSGKPDQHTWIPITNYTILGDSIFIDKYVDEGVTEKQSYVFKYWNISEKELVEQKTFWLGTDKFGRDILSRLIIGTRVSLSVGGIALIISLTIGIFLGAMAGYYRGRVDAVIMWFINVVWSIPTLLLVFAITMALGKGFWQVFIAVGLTLWVSVARMIRGQVFSLREKEFIEATKVLAFSDFRIIVKHILPNALGPVLVLGASNFASAIVMEAGLSFLGVGVQAPQPSWGLMIKENYNFIITNNPALALVPGLAIMALVLSFNILGNALRDAMDVKQ